MESCEGGAGLPPQCPACSANPVIRLRDPDRHLCAEHLEAEIRKRVEATVRARAMICNGDRIAVAFSGGKDSTALLLLLTGLATAWDDVTLIAITIDEGIAGYREETIRSAEGLTRQLGIEHRIVSFSDLFGKDLDTILAGREERACSICGILRRRALLHAAKGAGATKIATGHNLDDEAQSVLMNVLRGDLPRLVRDSGIPSQACFLPRIKPLRQISEKEIAVFLMVRHCFPSLPSCPYTRYALRADVRSGLSLLEQQNPGTMRRLVEGRERLQNALAGVHLQDALLRCQKCGEPCSGTVCQACQLVDSILS